MVVDVVGYVFVVVRVDVGFAVGVRVGVSGSEIKRTKTNIIGGKIPFTPYSGFTSGTLVFTHYTSARRRYSPQGMVRLRLISLKK